MEIFIIAVLIGLIPAAIAKSKGRSFVGFWIYGALLFIVALPHALLMKTNPKVVEQNTLVSGGKKCPYCAEIIKEEAIKCRFCGADIPIAVSSPTTCNACGYSPLKSIKKVDGTSGVECPKCRKFIKIR